MKVKAKNGTIKVTLTESEAYRIFNFIDYASREGSDWIASGPWGVKSLNRDEYRDGGGLKPIGTQVGQRETRELADLMLEVNDYMEVDLGD